ncbi:MAG: S8 family serine peptidase, partial [Pseudomonadota bacterium]
VAVIDTGVDYNHVDLADNRWVNEGEIAGNGVDDDGNGYIDDVYGYNFAYGDGDPMDDHSHGTHCSGTIGAVGNNGIGVAGVNHTVRIMAVKFLDDWGSGWADDAISSIIYAVDNGAQILSNSWASGEFSQGLEDAISYANDHNVLFVAAAGNEYSNNDEYPNYPSNHEVPNVLAVAATDHNDDKPDWSNYGLTTVDLGAPGLDILSTVLGDEYDYFSGTSMATPHVAGAAALLKGYNPNLSALEIKSILMESVDLVASMDGKTVTGGRLNINNALFNTFNCNEITEIPKMECEALVALYKNTDGSNWMDNSGWLKKTTQICKWKGVKCRSGHVSSLELASNRLDGSIPAELTNLSELKKLFLNDNRLCGKIPVELKNLSNISKLKLDNNHLSASDSELIAWLDAHNPGWDETQTLCPSELQFSSATYSIAEDGEQATITVTRTNSSDGAISVDYATSDDTATAPDDYTQATGTLKWANGDDADKTFTVDIIHDSEQENDETLIITLSNPTGSGELGSLTTAELTIKNVIDCATVSDIPVKECEALVALYNSTNGENWEYNKGWLKADKVCSWTGVRCNDGHVLELSLSWNNLTGSIPTELGNLTNLETLELSDNQLTGSIPTELGNLTNLETLDLDFNQLTGSIPTELGNLTNLWELRLSGNQLTGTIPTELGNLTYLWEFYLYDNRLTGTIPTELGNLTYLEVLDLGGNQLTGTIPTELGNLTYLEMLFLSGNQLTGTIPTELGNLTYLEMLFLSGNQLTGSIPTELGNLTYLGQLYLNDNQLCGEIPVELKNLSNIPLPLPIWGLYFLKLDNNHLTASDSELIEWLNERNPGWDETQTPCPQAECKLQLSSATYSVAENKGQALISVTRTGSSDGAVTVKYASSDDTATAPDDYSETIGTLNWDDGDDAEKTFTIKITDDSAAEDNETLIVSLGSPTGGAKLGTPDTAMVTITDNDSAFSCKKVTDISKKECQTLVALYDSTKGAKWTNNAGWKTTNSPCSWYGVSCQGGNVTGLELGSNNLKGSISKKLSNLKKLGSLLLNDNKLSGEIPKSLMKLKKLTELDLNDNCFSTEVSSKLKKWLDEINLGWDETQTGCLH